MNPEGIIIKTGTAAKRKDYGFVPNTPSNEDRYAQFRIKYLMHKLANEELVLANNVFKFSNKR